MKHNLTIYITINRQYVVKLFLFTVKIICYFYFVFKLIYILKQNDLIMTTSLFF